MELKYVVQKHDGLEAWIKKGDNWIRLDFLLEYYLFQNVNLTKSFKGTLNDDNMVKLYSESLFAKFLEATSNGTVFDFEKYSDWINNNQSDIDDALKLLNN